MLHIDNIIFEENKITCHEELKYEENNSILPWLYDRKYINKKTSRSPQIKINQKGQRCLR